MTTFTPLFRYKRVILHVAFWITSILFYIGFFGHRQGNYAQTVLFVLALMPMTLATTYFILYFLLPRYLFSTRTRSVPRLLLFGFYTLVIYAYGCMMVMFLFFLNTLFRLGGAVPLDYTTVDIVFVMVGLFFMILVAVAIKLFFFWAEEQKRAQKLIEEKVKAELRMLRTQLNPHFLFNTLNSIYALTLSKSDRAPATVLKLSDMLDYVLYECKSGKVRLDHEIAFLQNYIDLQQTRYGKRIQVDLEVPEPSDVWIPPTLLLPLVENSYKHGADSRTDHPGWIRMRIELGGGMVHFHIANKRETTPDTIGGIGHENVRKQLMLLFGSEHVFDIDEQPGVHAVHLAFPVDRREAS